MIAVFSAAQGAICTSFWAAMVASIEKEYLHKPPAPKAMGFSSVIITFCSHMQVDGLDIVTIGIQVELVSF